MKQEEIIEMARQAASHGVENHRSGEVSYVFYNEHLMNFAKLVAQRERDRIYAEELPEPRLTGKFSITAGKFKCTGCTGTWTNREDAKHHSCKDYQ